MNRGETELHLKTSRHKEKPSDMMWYRSYCRNVIGAVSTVSPIAGKIEAAPMPMAENVNPEPAMTELADGRVTA